MDKAEAKRLLRPHVIAVFDAWRKRNGGTDNDVGLAFGYSGKSPHSMISSIRNGQAPPMSLVEKIATEFPDLIDAPEEFHHLLRAAKGVPPEPKTRTREPSHREDGYLPVVPLPLLSSWTNAVASGKHPSGEQEWVMVDPTARKPKAFLVPAHGREMTGKTVRGEIAEGDLLVVDPDASPEKDSTVLVRWRGRLSVRIYRGTKARVRLDPLAGSALEPIDELAPEFRAKHGEILVVSKKQRRTEDV